MVWEGSVSSYWAVVLNASILVMEFLLLRYHRGISMPL